MKKILKRMIIFFINLIKSNPKLKRIAIEILDSYPGLMVRLKNFGLYKPNYASFKTTRLNRELLVDITHVHKNDLKTGIQRVVRSIVLELGANDLLKDIDVQPIFLTDEDGFWCYKYVNANDEIVVPKKEDIFLGLDLNASIIGADTAGLLNDWKLREVKINFVVYDILPILRPQWWPTHIGNIHEEWLKTLIMYSDQICCISQAVKDDVEQYIAKHKDLIQKKPLVNWFHLGADIENSSPSAGMPIDANEVLQIIQAKPSFLIVGTIEPRKGHKLIIDAFDKLWEDGVDINLVIVGKEGWLVETLIKRLRNHPELNKHLFWLDGISDEYLEKVYGASTCLIAASEGEGFGLPLIEAAQQKLPIIARDLPIFREVAGEYAYYFKNNNDLLTMSNSVKQWLELYRFNKHPKSDDMPWLTWKESTKKLVNEIGLDE